MITLRFAIVRTFRSVRSYGQCSFEWSIVNIRCGELYAFCAAGTHFDMKISETRKKMMKHRRLDQLCNTKVQHEDKEDLNQL